MSPDSFVYFEPGARRCCYSTTRPTIWHQPAALPDGHLDRAASTSGRLRTWRRRAPSCRRTSARVAFLGEPFAQLTAWGVAAVNPRPLLDRLDYLRAVKTPLRARLPARARAGLVRAGMSLRRTPLPAVPSEFEIELAFLARLRTARAGAALQPDHRAQRGSGSAALSGARTAGAARAAFDADRCRLRVRWLRERHHAHVFAQPMRTSPPCIAQMDEVQQSLCASVRAGVDWRDVHLLCASPGRRAAASPADIIRCEADEAHRDRAVERVPAARHRPSAGPAGSRRRRVSAVG